MARLEASTGLESVEVDIRVVIGRSQMPIHRLLRMGRGAVIELETQENEQVEILANGHLVAYGQVIVHGKQIDVEVSRPAGSSRNLGVIAGEDAV